MWQVTTILHKDVERGKSRSDYQSETSWKKIFIMIFALGVLVAGCAVSWFYESWQTGLTVLGILISVYVCVFYWRWIYVAIMTAPRDFKSVYEYIKILLFSRIYEKKNYAIPDIFHERVEDHPDKPCFLFEEESWTFHQIEEFSLRVTAVLKKAGFKKDDVIAVMMNNCPEMPATWLGIGRIGAVAPLINTNQTGSALLHSINVAQCNAVIYGSEFEETFQDISKELDPTIKLYKFTRRPLNTSAQPANVVESSNDFTSSLENTPPMPWALSEGDGFKGKLLYIYTSGTTGLPKAAVISNSRVVFMACALQFLGSSLRSDDIIYCPMPLYHSAGGCITMGLALVFGHTVILKTKFSASAFFKDCIKYKATAAQYIGEMCRYVLATPPSPIDKQHTVRVVYGNGMRPAIWTDFVKRFNIEKVVEYYGATEGSANILNVDNKPGAIGYVSRTLRKLYPVDIIKVDDNGEPVRNSKGLCQSNKPIVVCYHSDGDATMINCFQLADTHEPGVVVGKIKTNHPSGLYTDYVDKKASDKKIIRDVFRKGDAAFISGDILVADEFGYLFFLDRTGDTFRWRGENVSTAEIESVISRVIDQKDAVVYGVMVPNTEGRAGMCGIVDPTDSVDFDKLTQDIAKDVPKYARPIFIRILMRMDMTGTFKMRKVDLVNEGFNPAVVKDKLYYFDPTLNKYVPLGQEEYNKIVSGEIRL